MKILMLAPLLGPAQALIAQSQPIVVPALPPASSPQSLEPPPPANSKVVPAPRITNLELVPAKPSSASGTPIQRPSSSREASKSNNGPTSGVITARKPPAGVPIENGPLVRPAIQVGSTVPTQVAPKNPLILRASPSSFPAGTVTVDDSVAAPAAESEGPPAPKAPIRIEKILQGTPNEPKSAPSVRPNTIEQPKVYESFIPDDGLLEGSAAKSVIQDGSTNRPTPTGAPQFGNSLANPNSNGVPQPQSGPLPGERESAPPAGVFIQTPPLPNSSGVQSLIEPPSLFLPTPTWTRPEPLPGTIERSPSDLPPQQGFPPAQNSSPNANPGTDLAPYPPQTVVVDPTTPSPLVDPVLEGSLESVPFSPNAQNESPQEPVQPLAEPYWVVRLMRDPVDGQAPFNVLEFDQAIWDALQFSPGIKATLTVPLQTQAKIAEEAGAFDPTPFADSVFKELSDPVGNTLTTGGPPRLNEFNLDNGVGVKRKNQLGGTSELSQTMLFRDSNSVFLKPTEQADTKLLVRLNQPLMRGAGRAYATASIRIAEFNAGSSQSEAMRKMQLHAAEVANAYWDLFAAHSIAMQSSMGKQRLMVLQQKLEARIDIDALRSQLYRASAAVQKQEAAYRRALAQVATAEAKLRALINSPDLQANQVGIVPRTAPIDQPFIVDRMNEVAIALSSHPDVLAKRDQIRAATTRLKVAENELRPTLNLVFDSYVRGLNGDYDVANSFGDQFANGRPSFTAGLNYQRPYRQTTAKAIRSQRFQELRQLLFELDDTMLRVTADVERAIQEVLVTYNELEAAVYSTLAFDADVRQLTARLNNPFGDGVQQALLLDELLNAQAQLIQSENSWAQSQADHMKAFANLHVATGTLLNSMPVPAIE